MDGFDFMPSEVYVRLVEGIRFISLDIYLLETTHGHYEI